MGADTCTDALSHVYLNQTRRSRPDSIMFSMTQHQDRTCLSWDDLEGLNYLYPVCEGAFEPLAETGEPLCIKVQRLTGWLRLMYTVAIPFMMVALLIIVLQLCVRQQQKKRMVSLEATADRLRAQRALLVRKMRDGAKRRSLDMARGAARRSNAAGASGARSSFGDYGRGASRFSTWGASPAATPRGTPMGNPVTASVEREQQLERELRNANEQLQQCAHAPPCRFAPWRRARRVGGAPPVLASGRWWLPAHCTAFTCMRSPRARRLEEIQLRAAIHASQSGAPEAEVRAPPLSSRCLCAHRTAPVVPQRARACGSWPRTTQCLHSRSLPRPHAQEAHTALCQEPWAPTPLGRRISDNL
jgi:hypothetical protein